MINDLRAALRAVWLITALTGAAVAAAPFLMSAQTLGQIFPSCPAREAGHPCSACGMTTAFAAIANGRFDEAANANSGAIPLFLLLAVNAAAAAAYSAGRLIGGKPCKS